MVYSYQSTKKRFKTDQRRKRFYIRYYRKKPPSIDNDETYWTNLFSTTTIGPSPGQIKGTHYLIKIRYLEKFVLFLEIKILKVKLQKIPKTM